MNISRTFTENFDNIKFHYIHYLKPFVRKSLRRQFKINISKRLYKYMKEQNLKYSILNKKHDHNIHKIDVTTCQLYEYPLKLYFIEC